MFSLLNKSDYGRGSPDFKAGGWLCCLEEGKSYNMKTRLMRADVLCAFAECLPSCRSDGTFCLYFIVVLEFYKLMYPFLARQQQSREEVVSGGL